MTSKQIYPLILVLAALFSHSCANDNKKTTQQPLETHQGQGSTADSIVEKVEDATQQQKTRDNNTASESTAPQTPSKFTPPGPVAYVSRPNTILQVEPNAKSAKIQSLKEYDNVYLLETIMTNPAGKMTDYPTWYRVECQNKRRGWVVATNLGVGGGG